MTVIICIVAFFLLLVGFEIGRWWAETRRATHDMSKTWDRRRHYREDD